MKDDVTETTKVGTILRPAPKLETPRTSDDHPTLRKPEPPDRSAQLRTVTDRVAPIFVVIAATAIGLTVLFLLIGVVLRAAQWMVP